MLQVAGLAKSFPGVQALRDVSFDVAAGEIHALVGENGAGKSTLIRIVAGADTPDAGRLVFDGRERHWSSPEAARQAGIHVIYQELVLFPDLSVAENIAAGRPPTNRIGLIDRRRMHDEAEELLDRLGHALDVRAKVRELSVADRQMVEIAKALVGDTRLLILDEPTAVISGQEVTLLFDRMRALREAGVAIVYISHRLEEIFEIADRVTVLKDGRLVATAPVAGMTRERLIGQMVGRELSDIYPERSPPAPDAPTVLEVRGLAAGPRVRDVSFSLRAGEILGLAGLVGAGRTEVAHAIFGSEPIEAGEVLLDGRPAGRRAPARSIAAGLGFLTEDRKAEGLFPDLHVAANISAPLLDRLGALMDFAREKREAAEEIRRYRIAARAPEASIVSLSGGNQQKALFARWVRACDRLLILDEPTRGVDVGAKVEIYRIVRDLAAQGVAILLISSELPEITGLCHRVVTMREGRVTGELAGPAIAEEAVMHLATLEGEATEARAP